MNNFHRKVVNMTDFSSRVRVCLLYVLSFLFIVEACTREKSLLTHFEKSGGLETPRYDETVSFCKQLDKISPAIKYTSFGKSPQGRDLPLLIADKNGNFTPESVRKSGNLVLMIQACIHAGEPDGKDAGLLLMRNIAAGDSDINLLDHMTIIFIPIFNVDGHERFGPYNRINQNGPKEMGWRTNAQNKNLNRDYLKADTPEMEAWLQFFNQWLPDFIIDCHTTDGADYQYVSTYSFETLGNLDFGLTQWIASDFEPFLKKEMEEKGLPISPYVEFRKWHDPRSGLTASVTPPGYFLGYAAAHNRPQLLIESHMLKPYKSRVMATYEIIRLSTKYLNKNQSNLAGLVKDADENTKSLATGKSLFPLSFIVDYSDSTMVGFKGFEYTKEKSSITGGDWFKYDNTKPVTWKLPMYSKNTSEVQVVLPLAYCIPEQYAEIIKRSRLHGIEMRRLAHDCKIKALISQLFNSHWEEKPNEGRHKLNCSVKDSLQEVILPSGTIIVEMRQRSAKVAAYLFEPLSPDGFLAWGFFDAVLEQKEFSESYIMEKIAREMLDNDSKLAEEFKTLKQKNNDFANNPLAILNWFYSKTPYWDKQYNIYPIIKVLDPIELEKLK